MFSVYALTDASENVVERYRYDAYGACTVLDADGSADSDGISDVLNPYAFTGRRTELESGLMQYRNRCYAPALGRFISRDPAGYADAYDLYLYATDRPTFAGDPMGERWDFVYTSDTMSDETYEALKANIARQVPARHRQAALRNLEGSVRRARKGISVAVDIKGAVVARGTGADKMQCVREFNRDSGKCVAAWGRGQEVGMYILVSGTVACAVAGAAGGPAEAAVCELIVVGITLVDFGWGWSRYVRCLNAASDRFDDCWGI